MTFYGDLDGNEHGPQAHQLIAVGRKYEASFGKVQWSHDIWASQNILSHCVSEKTMIPALTPDSDDIAAFLQSTDVIDWKHVEVRRKSDSLTMGASTINEKVRALFEWVRDEIPHSKDADLDVVTCRASEVLKAGTGICYAKSHLFAALLRAQRIPAGFCYQVLRHDPPLNGIVLHGISGVYMRENKEWLLLDPRGNTNGCNAQFGIQDDGLAFQTDDNFGEFTYPTVYHCPAPVVVNILQAYKSREEMWPHLPSSLS
ncbi:MAG: transglutaminase-like domain-containing protein [Nitrospirales bacterium]|nr:transglutaminase-like domain-containing protein [Nitrospirales bacterium]